MSERKSARYGLSFQAGKLFAAGLLLAGAQAARTGQVTVIRTHLGLPGTAGQDMVTFQARFQMVPEAGDAAGGSADATMSGETGTRLNDTCLVTLQDGKTFQPGMTNSAAAASKLAAGPPSALDAGDPLTIGTATTAYATFVRHSGQNGPSYTAEKPSTGGLAGFLSAAASALSGGMPGAFGPLPEGTALNIPGASGPGGFPAFQNVALPSAAPFDLTAPADRAALTPETVFRWTNASNQEGARVTLTGMQDISGPDGKKQTLLVLCTASDDGEFSFPEATRTDLSARGFTKGTLLFTGRTLSRKLTQEDATLTLSVQDIEVNGAGSR